MPPDSSDDLSTLERMRRKLYASDAPESFPAPSLPTAAPEPSVVAPAWTPPEPVAKKRRVSYAALFLIAAVLFFVVSAAAATYFLVFGGRAVSTDSIAITPDGPSTIGSGDTVTLLISIRNENPVPALSTAITVDLPETARMPENPEQASPDIEDTVGDIPAGETRMRSVRTVLFGGEGERIVIPIRFEYRIEGSNAVFVKEAEYEVTVTSSPISIRAEAVSEITAGQPLSFAVTVRSNATGPLQNVGVALSGRPAGFQLRTGEGPVFPVGTLMPGEERTVTVTGSLSGEDSEERFFGFTVGLMRGEDTNALLASYSTADVRVTVAKPFLSATFSVNRDTGTKPVIDAGVPVQGLVSWVNTLAGPLLDGQVEVKLSGAALDPTSVSAFGGFYRSSDTTIIFSRETDGSLARLDPGATGSGSFNFRTKPSSQLAGTKNPIVTATVSVAGRRVGESNVPERVAGAVTRTIKVGTELTLSASALYSTGAFTNTGPWPPAVDQETTYTIELALANSVNAVADTVVSAKLPSYVRYTGKTSPSDGSVSYNEATRTVTWKAGEVAPGTGYGQARRTASFQVALLPSASQRGTSPVLVSGITVAGFDRFAEKQLSIPHPEITIQTNADPAFLQGKGIVK